VTRRIAWRLPSTGQHLAWHLPRSPSSRGRLCLRPRPSPNGRRPSVWPEMLGVFVFWMLSRQGRRIRSPTRLPTRLHPSDSLCARLNVPQSRRGGCLVWQGFAGAAVRVDVALHDEFGNVVPCTDGALAEVQVRSGRRRSGRTDTETITMRQRGVADRQRARNAVRPRKASRAGGGVEGGEVLIARWGRRGRNVKAGMSRWRRLFRTMFSPFCPRSPVACFGFSPSSFPGDIEGRQPSYRTHRRLVVRYDGHGRCHRHTDRRRAALPPSHRRRPRPVRQREHTRRRGCAGQPGRCKHDDRSALPCRVSRTT